MNPFIQNVLAITALVFALGFIFTKYFVKKKSKKACGGDKDCGCH